MQYEHLGSKVLGGCYLQSQLGLTGVTFVVSSGDDGAHGADDPECFTNRTYPEWPTSSPWVLSVGATEFQDGGVPTGVPFSPDCENYGVGAMILYCIVSFLGGESWTIIAVRRHRIGRSHRIDPYPFEYHDRRRLFECAGYAGVPIGRRCCISILRCYSPWPRKLQPLGARIPRRICDRAQSLSLDGPDATPRN